MKKCIVTALVIFACHSNLLHGMDQEEQPLYPVLDDVGQEQAPLLPYQPALQRAHEPPVNVYRTGAPAAQQEAISTVLIPNREHDKVLATLRARLQEKNKRAQQLRNDIRQVPKALGKQRSNILMKLCIGTSFGYWFPQCIIEAFFMAAHNPSVAEVVVPSLYLAGILCGNALASHCCGD